VDLAHPHAATARSGEHTALRGGGDGRGACEDGQGQGEVNLSPAGGGEQHQAREDALHRS
jgi:hypothetical protein